MYCKWAAELDFGVPQFEEFWRQGQLRLPTEGGLTLLADFRADPRSHRLNTPSGRIEIFSEDIDGFGYDDCAGHPKWFEPSEWLGGSRAARYPLHLLANQPASRLHSQLDIGASGALKCGARTDPDASGRRRAGDDWPMVMCAGVQ
jgi:biotin/methionine sulfoxide reductase